MGKLIITADTHLRGTLPPCRNDVDWLDTQRQALREVFDIARKKEAKVLIVGDLYHSARIPTYVRTMFLEVCAKNNDIKIEILTGNHDISYGNLDSLVESDISNLEYARDVKLLVGDADYFYKYGDDIILWHTDVYEKEEDIPPSTSAKLPEDLWNKYDAKWIFLGHIHKNFHAEKKGRHIIMPGCLTVQDVSFVDYQPVVYFVDTDTEEVEKIPITHNPDNIKTEYVQVRKNREANIAETQSFLQETKVEDLIDFNFEGINGRKIQQHERKEALTQYFEDVLDRGDE